MVARQSAFVRLANHLVDVHGLDHLQQRKYVQEAKQQPKVKVVVYESKPDNARKNHYTTTSIQYRHKKRCTNCEEHDEIQPLLKQKLNVQLQRTFKPQETKELLAKALGKLCRHGRIIY